MSRIHSTVIAMLFVIVSVSLVRADNPNPLVFNMYVTPTISGYSMSCDNQKHERKYDVSGTAEITYVCPVSFLADATDYPLTWGGIFANLHEILAR